MLKSITISNSPHISDLLSTRRVMIDVVIGLVPAMVAAVIFFRTNALLLIVTCCLSVMATEWFCNILRKRPNSLDDFSAIVTGIIFALSVPPALPLWAAVVGSCFSIAIGKMVFGGLGCNIFNPAMVGRAFLAASFGMLMTTWTVPATIDSQMPRITSSDKIVDIRTQATPLALSKQAIKEKEGAQIVNNQLSDIFVGHVGGCLGETSSLAILIGAVYLFIRKTIKFHIPLFVLLGAFVFSLITHLINPQGYVSPFIHLSSGAILFCAFFIATDPVTAPLTTRGMWIFGAGVGIITMLIRIVGEYPEGVMYAVLLMNAVTPLIDKFCKLIPAGGIPNE
ncbi:MAG: RnfABCDGE type electron transport complex subunit D [Planctomycetota bacterium]|jgi:electron transport complex protein RnfD